MQNASTQTKKNCQTKTCKIVLVTCTRVNGVEIKKRKERVLFAFLKYVTKMVSIASVISRDRHLQESGICWQMSWNRLKIFSFTQDFF